MAKKRVYWDSCAWLGLINGEPDKRRELEIIYDAARKGDYEIWTSTISLVEVNRYNTEYNIPKPLSQENLEKIEKFFSQPFIKMTSVDMEIGNNARKILRETPRLSKKLDAVHLASALKWSIDTMHTYDGSDLLHLSSKFMNKAGRPLVICIPDEDSDGPLFAHPKKT